MRPASVACIAPRASGRRLGSLVVLLAALALTGCGSVPSLPDYSYYRLPPVPALQPAGRSLAQILVVDEFDASDLYADPPIVYALRPDARELRRYHYRLWADAPGSMLRWRLISELRAAALAPLVSAELPRGHAALRIQGTILRFDRVPDPQGGQQAVVALQLRVDGSDGQPLLDRSYRERRAAAGSDMDATVLAFGAATDAIFVRFRADLERLEESPDAR